MHSVVYPTKKEYKVYILNDKYTVVLYTRKQYTVKLIEDSV